MKPSKNCDCSNKSKCIVITIETCCKKNCEEYKKSHGVKIKGDGSDKEVKKVASGPVVTEKSSSGSKVREELSKNEIEDQPDEEIGDGKSASKQKVPEKEPSTQIKKPRLFKLPLLLERHHGPGCAMEISVLEKHEDTCLYKKEDTEGRNEVDDRVGSYDCIGRMVFRTCNSTETESDSSKLTVHGGSITGNKNTVEVLHPPVKESKAKSKEDSKKDLKEKQIEESKEESKEEPKEEPKKEEEKKRNSQQSDRMSIRSEQSNSGSSNSKQRDEEKLKSTESSVIPQEEPVILEKKEEQIMMAKTAIFQNAVPLFKQNTKKHYPGDGCKLHSPKAPSFLTSSAVVDQASVSNKRFPLFTVERGNQTDVKVEKTSDLKSTSQETIASLTDLTKSEEKRKSGFLGSLFRRSSAGKPNVTDSKK